MKLSQFEKQKIINREVPSGIILGLVFFLIVLAMTSIESLKPFMTKTNIIGGFLITAGVYGALSGQTISYNTFSWKIYAFRGLWVRLLGIFFALIGIYLILLA